jgi:hypothetical protein
MGVKSVFQSPNRKLSHNIRTCVLSMISSKNFAIRSRYSDDLRFQGV